jgi:hypothetical protein
MPGGRGAQLCHVRLTRPGLARIGSAPFAPDLSLALSLGDVQTVTRRFAPGRRLPAEGLQAVAGITVRRPGTDQGHHGRDAPARSAIVRQYQPFRWRRDEGSCPRASGRSSPVRPSAVSQSRQVETYAQRN